MNSYNDAYKSYYDNIRKKVRVENKKENLISSNEDIYPVKTQIRQGNYSYNGSYTRLDNNLYNRGNIKNSINNNKKIRYIDKFVIKIIISSLILLSLYSLKVNPNKQANKIFEICKENISKEIDYKVTLKYIKEKIEKFSNEIKIDEYLKL